MRDRLASTCVFIRSFESRSPAFVDAHCRCFALAVVPAVCVFVLCSNIREFLIPDAGYVINVSASSDLKIDGPLRLRFSVASGIIIIKTLWKLDCLLGDDEELPSFWSPPSEGTMRCFVRAFSARASAIFFEKGEEI
jgi:hypothetical protein